MIRITVLTDNMLHYSASIRLRHQLKLDRINKLIELRKPVNEVQTAKRHIIVWYYSERYTVLTDEIR